LRPGFNQPKTLSGIETNIINALEMLPLKLASTNPKPFQGLKQPASAFPDPLVFWLQPTQNPFRD